MPKSKRTVKNGVDQLTLTFGLCPTDEAPSVQDNGPSASIKPAVVETGFEFLGFHYFKLGSNGVICKEVRANRRSDFATPCEDVHLD